MPEQTHLVHRHGTQIETAHDQPTWRAVRRWYVSVLALRRALQFASGSLQRACAPPCPAPGTDNLWLTFETVKSISMCTPTAANCCSSAQLAATATSNGYLATRRPRPQGAMYAYSFPGPIPGGTVEAMGRWWDTRELAAHHQPPGSQHPQLCLGTNQCLELVFTRGREQGSACCFVSLQDIERQSHGLRVQAWGTCHRLHK